MDISSIYGSSALDSTAYTNAANQTASKLQNQLNGSDYTKATDDELMDACKQFEAYFLEQMFKEMMRRHLPRSLLPLHQERRHQCSGYRHRSEAVLLRQPGR